VYLDEKRATGIEGLGTVSLGQFVARPGDVGMYLSPGKLRMGEKCAAGGERATGGKGCRILAKFRPKKLLGDLVMLRSINIDRLVSPGLAESARQARSNC
jgi:hypothetical protein